MTKRIGIRIVAVVVVMLVVGMAAPSGRAAGTSTTVMVKHILETVRAFRTIYAKAIVNKAKGGGMRPLENWRREQHALMLPAQFVKAAATQIKGYDLGLVSLDPIYKSNLPRTAGEINALKAILASRNTDVVVFEEGNQVKGMMGDFAIAQTCIDCHNQHPRSPKRDYKMGDLMGGLIVRITK